MTIRLVLLCAGATASARTGSFPGADDPLDAGGPDKVRTLDLGGPTMMACWTSPARAARETAAIMGMAGEVAPALRDMDAGDWAGRGLDEIAPPELAAWLAAPEQGAPGGEDMAAVWERVAAWMDELGDGRWLAITHAAVVRAAVAHALGVPVAATLGIDVAPLSITVLSHHDRWRLQELRRG